MKRIRIGKDININLTIQTNGLDEELSNLTIFILCPNGDKICVDSFDIENNVVSFVLRGRVFSKLGLYSILVWKNLGADGLTVLDFQNAFELVKYTTDEYETCRCKH